MMDAPDNIQRHEWVGPKDDLSLVRFPLSVIVLTYNEAVNITACLGTIDWADDVIIVDSGSGDGTSQLARETRPDVRVFVHPFRDFGDQRNWALDNTTPSHAWVLFLDADERCNDECAAAIRSAMASPGPNVGFYLTYRNYFLGTWIKRCTLYPSWQLRLLKLGEVRFQKEGHGQREVSQGSLGYIPEPYDHYGFSKGLTHWVERHNRYSSEEMELRLRLREEPIRFVDLVRGGPVSRRRFIKRVGARMPCRPLLRFLYTYFFRKGFLDGRAGLIYCLLRAAHEIHVDAKLAEATLDAREGRSDDTRLAAAHQENLPADLQTK